MCGICGWIGGNIYEKEQRLKIVKAMNRSIAHRGPDDSGEELFDNFGRTELTLGFVRLSIRDLSLKGHQPMWNERRDICITFNGEIYNAEALRTNLIGKGYQFCSSGDTEVLLYMYQEYGINDTLKQVDGMFAFAIADVNKETVYLCRDRLGEKPLYVYSKEDLILWASEPKAFYRHPQFKPELNTGVLDEYLMFRYVAGEEGLLKHVKNITPGTYLKIKGGSISQYTYWENGKQDHFAANNEDLKSLLERAVKSRLVSDAPLGVQLSGGVDSSYVTYLAANHIDKLRAYGVVFKDELSEEPYMDIVTKLTGTQLEKVPYEKASLPALWTKTTFFMDSPIMFDNTMALYELNMAAARDVKVLVAGEGADETFGGYQRYGVYKKYAQNEGARIAHSFKQYLIKEKSPAELLWALKDLNHEFILYSRFNSARDVQKTYREANIKEMLEKRYKIFESSNGNGIHQVLNYEKKTYLESILMRSDRSSMAASVELRVPLLAPEVVEYSNKIPEDDLVANISNENEYSYNTKRILKKIVADIFGEDFVYRKKCGFGLPIGKQLSDPDYKGFFQYLLKSIEQRELLDYKYVRKLYNRFQKTRDESITKYLFTVFSLEIFLILFIDSDPNYYKDSELWRVTQKEE